jgi:glycosyltransferase involved in cell wall biosynthesis
MRLLFVKPSLSWPRSSGHDVHCYYMMRALIGRGHEVSLATVEEPHAGALDGLALASYRALGGEPRGDGGADGLRATRLQERFRSYWGIDESRVRAVARAARDCDADAVVAVGLDVLPYLLGISDRARVWYAADEWAWHHLSLLRPGRPEAWEHAKQSLIKGLYERVYAPILDRIWVVSEADRRAMRCVAGIRTIDVIANGVDGDHYRPVDVPEIEQSGTFWGRLDFGPNVQALEWFCGRVWPLIRREAPAARFTIYGFRPSSAVRALAGRDGIDLVPDLPDLRAEIARHQVVVLPFISGGGIKNKLLEAAGMARPIVCSPRACGGLYAGEGLPVIEARGGAEWARAIQTLWRDESRRRQLGAEARRWVLQHHSWDAAARSAEASLGRILASRLS